MSTQAPPSAKPRRSPIAAWLFEWSREPVGSSASTKRGFFDEQAGQRDPLLLTSREASSPLVQSINDADPLQGVVHHFTSVITLSTASA